MKLNIFKRVKQLENGLTTVQRVQPGRIKRERAQQVRNYVIHLCGKGIECIIDRIDFSGDDHEHYALILYRNGKFASTWIGNLQRSTKDSETLEEFFKITEVPDDEDIPSK